MKKIGLGLLVLSCILVAVACGSATAPAPAATTEAPQAAAAAKERRVPSAFPDFVKDAIMNAPEDVLVGIGTAKLASLSQSMTISATRARAEISRQMNTMVQDMVRDYQASSEVDPDSAISFQENITVALSKSTLTGSKIVESDQDANGNVWTVVHLGKADVVNEINQAQAAAKLAIPAMASFNAEDRMNAAFEKAFGEEAVAAGE